MPRFLRHNLLVRGLATSDSRTTANGIYTPAGAGMLVAQCIPWPFAADMYGDTMPSGIVGVRTISASRTIERAWATPGDATENQDRWIAVPDTLPGAYTSRPGRDIDRGPRGSILSRGAPYFDVTFVNDPFNATFSGGASTANTKFVPAFERGTGPFYRPSGGGGIVGPLTWYPMNVSDKVVKYISRDAGNGIADPAIGWDFADTVVASFSAVTGGIWLQRHVGWRQIKYRTTITVKDSFWATLTNSEVKAQVIIRHNASGLASGIGDTLAYKSAVFNKSSFTQGPASPYLSGYSAYYMDHTLTSSNYGYPTAAGGLRAICPNSFIYAGKIAASANCRTSWGPSPATSVVADYVYATQFSARPRVDVPLWFSAYGAGVGAPGGIP